MKIALPTAAVIILAAYFVSGLTKVFYWPASLFFLGLGIALYGFNATKVALVALGLAVVLFVIALAFYSGWLQQ